MSGQVSDVVVTQEGGLREEEAFGYLMMQAQCTGHPACATGLVWVNTPVAMPVC